MCFVMVVAAMIVTVKVIVVGYVVCLTVIIGNRIYDCCGMLFFFMV